jgi:hypothetical protein
MRASFERLLSLDPVTALYCHALGSHSPDVIHQNIAYFADIERRAAAALASGDVPTAFDAISDIETLIGYPFEEVPHIEGLDVEERAFYLGGHRSAIRSTLNYLSSQSSHPR